MRIDADLVRRLVAEQLPQWADLPVRPVPVQGNDNRTFRLGDELAVRLPSAEGYVAGVAKEDRALPLLAPHVGVALPEVVASGVAGQGYPWPWSVRRWIDGVLPEDDPALDRVALARDLGRVLVDLRAAPTAGGPAAGEHSFHRGSHPSAYAHEVAEALHELDGAVDTVRCQAIWADAMDSTFTGEPVWFHGDVAGGNLLVRDGRLVAVIDFGTCGVGDPACDLVPAWTMFRGEERAAFQDAVEVDDATWARARGWALWKALATLAWSTSAMHRAVQGPALAELLADDHRS